MTDHPRRAVGQRIHGYGQIPDGWELKTEHYNTEGERFGLATCDHPDHAGKTLLIVWDDPIPKGTGTAGIAILDDGTMAWLVESMLTTYRTADSTTE